MKVPLLRLSDAPMEPSVVLHLFCPNAMRKWRILDFDFQGNGQDGARNVMAVVTALALNEWTMKCPSAFEEVRGHIAVLRYNDKPTPM